MKLVPYDERKVRIGLYSRTKNLRILEEFRDSEYSCVRVEDFEQKDSHCCANSLNASIKRFHMYNIAAFERKGEVYLVKLK